MNKTLLYSLAWLAIFASVLSQAAEMKIEMIPLNNRTADEMINLIRPLVTKGGTVTGMHNQLIVKTTPGNLVEIKRLLRSLDRPLRRLMITVRQDIDTNQQNSGQSVSGNVSSGDINVSTNSPIRNRQGLEIDVSTNGNNVRYKTFSTHSTKEDKNDFRLQTVEGQPAFIDTGKSVPVANQTAYATRGGVVIQDSIEYRDVTSGFYVLPQLNGNRVTLLISPKLSRVNPHDGSFDIQNVETTVMGQLGEWIDIGGVSQQSRREGSGVLYSTRRQGQESRSVLIMVEEIP